MRATLALVALVLPWAAVASPVRFADYVHVEANEGGSSGGHVAIRVEDETYHFQHESPGLLRLRRDDWTDFRHRYGGLENRTIHLSRVVLPADAFRRLRTRLSERYLRERKLFAYREALRDDRTLLALLLARRRGDARRAIALRGAGYFLPADEPAGRSDVLRALRERIERTHGHDAVRRRAVGVRKALARLVPPTTAVAVDVPDDGYPAFAPTYSERYRDLATELVALDVLDRALPLRSDARRAPTDDGFRLSDVERRALDAFAERLADVLVRLVGTERPDLGFTLLVGMARLEALSESARTGRLVVLDVFPPEAIVVPAPRRRHLETLRGLRAEAGADLARWRARLDDDLGEADFARLEAAANRVVELDGAITRNDDLRVTGAPLGPSREAPWPDAVDPDVGDAALARAVTVAGTVQRRFEARLEVWFGYDLIVHNCVSELFRTVEAAGVQLGGHVGSPWSLEFIPFVAARAVDGTWRVVERTTQPSYRRARMDELVRREGWRARLRESNVATSTIYRRNDEDSAFLLFTDDAVVVRPLFGAVNVAVGIGAGVAGMALLPLDRGHLLAAGLRGVLYSVPELAFVNLRKGSFDYVPRGPAAPSSVLTREHDARSGLRASRRGS